MSTLGCQRGTVGGGDCSTTRGAVFTHPLTVNVYQVGTGNEPGALIRTVTHTFCWTGYHPAFKVTAL